MSVLFAHRHCCDVVVANGLTPIVLHVRHLWHHFSPLSSHLKCTVFSLFSSGEGAYSFQDLLREGGLIEGGGLFIH